MYERVWIRLYIDMHGKWIIVEKDSVEKEESVYSLFEMET